MGLDIRIPIGLLFLITGGLMSVYGMFTLGSEIYEKSLGINLNLEWGLLMFVFGAVMYFFGRRPHTPPPPGEMEPISEQKRVGH